MENNGFFYSGNGIPKTSKITKIQGQLLFHENQVWAPILDIFAPNPLAKVGHKIEKSSKKLVHKISKLIDPPPFFLDMIGKPKIILSCDIILPTFAATVFTLFSAASLFCRVLSNLSF